MAATIDSLVMPGNRRWLHRLVRAHRDVLEGVWTLGQICAVRRQRRFSKMMAETVTDRGCAAANYAVTEALVQHPQFLAMMALDQCKGSMVPTITIDLAWHTHQLTPAAYMAHIVALVSAM
ncbi:hypothetical protein AMAG_11190 [Allomyces macrogynus ATCC 38327]|uniref:Uncharacterized protein n=1 Tax=Allomyces macrogynus (strain ATCC 38327) TaxID=578462 RepID=A0A0L0SVS0_ALLM3|nr:hypothetical protein AMAG_11188 [Allomyces macrogynus ATCC 38327]KNE66690.1 hypothetical protein AMAG_11190 [Allomyces macrogynus ATCC 38327]|eukprot:KNE66688.1 hypothetical protein AMAG_11188 [Allomyces macrogynus ATCC 38327]